MDSKFDTRWVTGEVGSLLTPFDNRELPSGEVIDDVEIRDNFEKGVFGELGEGISTDL